MTEFLRTLPVICAHTLKTVRQPRPRPKSLKNVIRQGSALGDGMSRADPDYYDRFLSQSYQKAFPTTYILKFLQYRRLLI